MSANRSAERRRDRPRLAGPAPGALTFVGAWIVGVAIARLTGAVAVVIVLAAVFVGFVVSSGIGWQHARRVRLVDVAGPTLASMAETSTIAITIDTGHPIAEVVGEISVPGFADRGQARPVHEGATDAIGTWSTQLRWEHAGVADRVNIRISTPGPGGLVWWRRTFSVAVEPIHVAPVPNGRRVPTETSTTRVDGQATTGRGNDAGEIDGVRSWRDGDSVAAVHWPSTMRADELIVHDRRRSSSERWTVDLDGVTDAAALHSTLLAGLRTGHQIEIRSGQEHTTTTTAITSDDAAARASAVVAERIRRSTVEGDPPVVPMMRRPLRWPTSPERALTLSAPARWTAGVASFVAIAMLLDALGAPTVQTAGAGVALAIGSYVSIRVARSGRGRSTGLTIALGIAAIGALVLIGTRAAGIDGLLATLRGPMPDLLVLLVAIHGFEVVDRRTLRVHQAIGMVVAMYAAGLRIDGALGWWLGTWGTAFALSVAATIPRPHRRAARPDATSTTVVRVGTLVVLGVVATLGVLAVVPIPDGPARLGLPALSNDSPAVETAGALAGPDGSPVTTVEGDSSRAAAGEVRGYPGFTETLDTSIRGELGDEVVMRVRAPEPAFWRGQTFTDFDGQTWSVSPDPGTRRSGPTIAVPPTVGGSRAIAVESEELVQTYFVEADLPNIVFAASEANTLIFDGDVWTRPDGALRSDVTLTEGSVYTVVSDRIQVTPDILRAQGDLGRFYDEVRAQDPSIDAMVSPFLELPDSTTQRTIDLATELHRPGASTYDTILAYERWLATNTEYDLDAPVPDPGSDAVDDHLFESQRGFCEQIASSLTIMLRSEGVPARLATGYVPGERDRVSGVWRVRASDAHAWVEVWFPQTGWQAFDPTAEVPLAGEADAGTVGGDLVGAAVSSVVSHPVEIGTVIAIAMLVVGSIRGLATRRHRRRRGRWGVLQDRFSALDPAATNPAVAERLRESGADDDGSADAVAAALDRVAFDPTWVDDDAAFDRARGTVDTLERRVR